MSDPLGDGGCFTPSMERRLTIPMRSMGKAPVAVDAAPREQQADFQSG